MPRRGRARRSASILERSPVRTPLAGAWCPSSDDDAVDWRDTQDDDRSKVARSPRWSSYVTILAALAYRQPPAAHPLVFHSYDHTHSHVLFDSGQDLLEHGIDMLYA